jgi:hypothetical protein
MVIVVAIGGLLLLSLFAIKALYLFSASNGLFAYFGKTLETGSLPNGILLQPWTTNGRIPALDWLRLSWRFVVMGIIRKRLSLAFHS